MQVFGNGLEAFHKMELCRQIRPEIDSSSTPLVRSSSMTAPAASHTEISTSLVAISSKRLAK